MSVELPKLSTFTQLLATPEVQFEKMVKESLNIELPPGPQSTLLKLQSSIEAGTPPAPEAFIPKAPKLKDILSAIPTLPPIPTPESPAAGTPATRPPAVTKARVY